jgi:guanylate kinase
MHKIYALLGGACVGKDTVRKMLLDSHEDLVEATSHTTRPMRATENGSEYYFIDVNEFMSMYEAGEFVETRT